MYNRDSKGWFCKAENTGNYKIRKDLKLKLDGHTLYRIQAVKDIPQHEVNEGDLGGWIESPKNLQENAWVHGNAKVYKDAVVSGNAIVYGDAAVYGNARVLGNAKVYGNAQVYGFTWVYGNARVLGNAKVYGNAQVYGFTWVYGNTEIYWNAKVYGDAIIHSNRDYIVFKNWWSSGRYFTWTRSNNMWKVGCFYGTGKELIAKAEKDSEISGREYRRVVEYVESILRDEK